MTPGVSIARLQLTSTSTGSRTGAPNRLGLLTGLQICLVAVILGIGMGSVAGVFDDSDMVYSVSLLLTAVIGWNFYSLQMAGRSWFEPYSLFLLSATLFNGGQAILEVFQITPNGVLRGAFSTQLTVSSLYLVTLSLASLHCGALVALGRHSNRPVPADQDTESSFEQLRGARYIGYSCLAVSLVPISIVLQDILTTSMAQGYGGLFDRSKQGIDAVLLVLAGFVIPGTMFLVAGSRGKTIPALIATCLIMVYAGTLLAAGSRGPAAMAIISFGWLYERSIRRLPRLALLGLGISLLFAFGVVGTIRNTPGFSQDRLVGQAFGSEDNPLISAVSEMGGSLATVAHTIRLFPEIRPFDGGASYAFALSTIIPNVGWDVHPAIAHGLLSDWLINTVDPAAARAGGGLGYSFIAEAYANFGWYGITPLMMFLGYLLTKLFRWGTDTTHPAQLAFIATFLACVLVLARGESGIVVRGLVWYALLPYLAVLMLLNKKTRRSFRVQRNGNQIVR
jgi:oligosaccharide repeat unit polymerase